MTFTTTKQETEISESLLNGISQYLAYEATIGPFEKDKARLKDDEYLLEDPFCRSLQHSIQHHTNEATT